jgi:hypothetical protein
MVECLAQYTGLMFRSRRVTAARRTDQSGTGLASGSLATNREAVLNLRRPPILRELIRSIHVDRSFDGQYRVPKTLVFATSFEAAKNSCYSWQNLLQKPSQNVRSINDCCFLDLRHAHWLRSRFDR